MFVLILFSVSILSFLLLPLAIFLYLLLFVLFLAHSISSTLCFSLCASVSFLNLPFFLLLFRDLPFLLPTQRTTSTSFSSLFVRMPQSCLIIHLSFSFIHFFGVNVKNVWKELNLELLLWTFFRQSLQRQSIDAVAAFPTFHRRLKKLKRWMEQTNKRVRRVEGGGRRVGRYV